MAIVNNKIVSTHFCCECCKHFRPFDSDDGTPGECWRFPPVPICLTTLLPGGSRTEIEFIHPLIKDPQDMVCDEWKDAWEDVVED